MKKVLLVATVQSHICQFHQPLVELLRENGWTVHVAARDNLNEKNGLKLDFADEVYDIPFCRSPFKLRNIQAYKMLKNLIDESAYDVVHCNTPVGGVLTRLAAQKARRKGMKVYYTAHGFHFYKGASALNWLIYYPIEKLLAKRTDKLITIVEEDFQLAKKRFNCHVERIHGVGVDEKRFYPISCEEKVNLRKQMGYSENQKIILCVGELLANKNQKMIIQCMTQILKAHPESILLLAGNGSKEEDLKTLIHSLNLEEYVKLIGYVTNIEDYHKLSDVLVSCSIREGLGLNVIESMMIGNPVVLTDNRGHRELIHNQQNGYLVSINDQEHLTKAVNQLLSDNMVYENFSSNVKEFGCLYSAKRVKQELRRIYELEGKEI